MFLKTKPKWLHDTRREKSFRKNCKHNHLTKPAGNIRVVSTFDQVVDAVEKFISDENYVNRFLGVDCEWDAVTRRGKPQIPDLLQIARSDGYCVLVRLNMLSRVPVLVKDLLEDRNYWKLGVGVVEDVKKLKQGFKIDTHGVLDIRFLAKGLKIKPKGMRFLSETVLGIKKPKYNYRYCWTRPHLTDEMVEYASGDAIIAAKVFETLNHKMLDQKWGDGWRQWSIEKYTKETFDLWKRFVGNTFTYHDEFNNIK